MERKQGNWHAIPFSCATFNCQGRTTQGKDGPCQWEETSCASRFRSHVVARPRGPRHRNRYGGRQGIWGRSAARAAPTTVPQRGQRRPQHSQHVRSGADSATSSGSPCPAKLPVEHEHDRPVRHVCFDQQQVRRVDVYDLRERESSDKQDLYEHHRFGPR